MREFWEGTVLEVEKMSYHLKAFEWIGNTDATNVSMCFITYTHTHTLPNIHTHTHTHTHTFPSPLFNSMTKINEQLNRDKKGNLSLSPFDSCSSPPGNLYLPPLSSLLHVILWTSMGITHCGKSFPHQIRCFIICAVCMEKSWGYCRNKTENKRQEA